MSTLEEDLSFYRAQIKNIDDERDANGRFPPVFPPLLSGSAKEEEFVARMVQRDRDLNWGY